MKNSIMNMCVYIWLYKKIGTTIKYSKLKDEYLKEESFWHVTSKGNLKSIEEKEI